MEDRLMAGVLPLWRAGDERYRLYPKLARMWAAVFTAVGVLFLLAPASLAAALTAVARWLGATGSVATPTGNLWYALALSLMVAVTGLAWVSARRPEAPGPFYVLVATKLASVAGFVYLAVTASPPYFLAALADGFVAFSLWYCRLTEGAGRSVRLALNLVPGFKGVWPGQPPFYEVWFGKVFLAPGRALWFRYTLCDREGFGEAAVWAVVFDLEKDAVAAARQVFLLEDLAPANIPILPAVTDPEEVERFSGRHQVFHLGPNHLDGRNALGDVGRIAWDLEFSNPSGRRFRHVPRVLRVLRVARTMYETPFLDVRFRGKVCVRDSMTVQLEGAPGMIGHISGSRSGHSWAWAHCNVFLGSPDAVFEGLSARVRVFGKPSRPLSSFVLWLEGRKYVFSSLVGMFRATSTFGGRTWTFRATARGAILEGEATLPGSGGGVALVTYTDTDGSCLWCRNTKVGDLRLRLTPEKGAPVELVATGSAAFELVGRDSPRQRPDL